MYFEGYGAFNSHKFSKNSILLRVDLSKNFSMGEKQYRAGSVLFFGG